MLDLDTILKRYRMAQSRDDCVFENMRLNRLYGLNDLIKENLNSNSVVCELGSHVGSSGSLFAYYCKLVYCVDIWSNTDDEIDFDIYMNNFTNVTKIKNTSVGTSFMFPDHNFDLVYIDAAHDYKSVSEDIAHWKNKVKLGGFLAGHDYNESSSLSKDVIKAINESLGKPDKVYEDSSWIKRL
jgi:hypothetical protein